MDLMTADQIQQFSEQFGILAPVVAALAGQYGGFFKAAATIVLGMGSMRVFAKPLMTVLERAIKASVTKRDDLLLEKAKASKWYKTIAFIADFLLSIKLPVVVVATKPKPGPTP